MTPEFLFGGRLDGAVGEEEGLPTGCARVQSDGVVGVGSNVGASGGAGEKEAELLVGNGGEVGAVAEGLSGDGYRCTDVVGAGAGSLCGIRHVPEAAEANDLRCVQEGGGLQSCGGRGEGSGGDGGGWAGEGARREGRGGEGGRGARGRQRREGPRGAALKPGVRRLGA